jgi:hypothetical protein
VDAILQCPEMDGMTYEYVIAVLNQSLPSPMKQGGNPPFSKSTANLLDLAAFQLTRKGNATCFYHTYPFPWKWIFANLKRFERLMAIDMLERLEVPLGSLPEPFTNNPGLTQSMKNTLTQLTLLGYYSEWPGYGSTRLERPDFRCIEYFPIGWIQTNYPGPAFGYRNIRGLFLQKKGGNHNV